MKLRTPLTSLALLVATAAAAWGQASAAQSETEMETVQPGALQAQLDETSAQSAKKFPAELMNKFKTATEELKASGIEKSAKQVGDQAIDATLTNWKGESVQLSQTWAKGPVVLMWYRGGW